MTSSLSISGFFSLYGPEISERAMKIRSLIVETLPGITEQIDLPAKMVAYCYGPKYRDMLCVLIPSKKGLKLGFSRGTQLPDPLGMLEGKGKLSRYVEIKNQEMIDISAIKDLLNSSLEFYQKKMC